MKKILFLVICLFVTFGCVRSSKRIPDEKLVSIVKDIYVSNAYVQKVMPNLYNDSLDYYNPIFKRYGYTIDDFRYTLYKMSTRKSSRISWVISAVLDSLNKEFAVLKYYKKIYDKIENIVEMESLDTIYARPESIVIEGRKNLSKADVCIKIDTNRIYTVKYRYKIDSVSSGQRLRTQIATLDKAGMLSNTNYKYYERSGYNYISTDMSIGVIKVDSLRIKMVYFAPKVQTPYVKVCIDSVIISSRLSYSEARDLALRRRLNHSIIKFIEDAQNQADSSTVNIVPPSLAD